MNEDCVIVAGGMSCVKVHCHTNEPNDRLSTVLK